MKTGSNCAKIRYGRRHLTPFDGGRKSGVDEIITYGPYVKSGNYADKMAWES